MPYSDCIVSYMDVLGFRRLVEESETNTSKVNEIERILEAFTRKGESDWHISTVAGVDRMFPLLTRTQTFSDLIVRVIHIRPELEFVQHLALELEILAKIQYELLELYKVLIRGGVCFKPMHWEIPTFGSGNFFGPGIVRSYQLAEKNAIYPRIIVDSDLAHAAGNFDAPWRKYILQRGEDGQYFVDYLNAQLHSHRAHPEADMELHRDFILEELEKHKGPRDESIRQKLIWMALYHNRTIDGLEQQAFKKHKIDMQRIW